MKQSGQHYNFNQLSMKDLIDAREHAHLQFMNKKNVVATALGRYLIRIGDIDINGRYAPNPVKTKRTLANSVVTDFSWPCVLVFVTVWEDDTALAPTSDNVPRSIFLEDGRVIPVCVVEAPQTSVVSKNTDELSLNFPTNLIGGGFPVKVFSQEVEHFASAGCIVTDGHTYYLLTNKHVSGDEGQEVTSVIGTEPISIGVSSGRSLGKVAFSELYPAWAGKNVKVNCDAGLVRLDDLNIWKTDVLGIGTMGPLFDLNSQTLNLGLIAEHAVLNKTVQPSMTGNVVAYGARSLKMTGEITALFYRYEALGGVEYVSDFLISGRNNTALNTGHGDSGTVWFLESEGENNSMDYYPLALHWGEHQVVDTKSKIKYPFALASNLTNICRELGVELVRDWNLDSEYSWGKVGHYTVGFQAVTSVKAEGAREFLNNNIDRISFPRTGINSQIDTKGNPALSLDPTVGFCPLADVPDIIWKQPRLNPAKGTGKAWGRQGDENPNHYADVDKPDPTGKTVFDYCPTASKLTIAHFKAYYDAIDKAAGIDITKPENTAHRGLIFFRVWQIYDYMVAAAAKGNSGRAEFMFAAGVLAHYVGDGCQPLHGSYMSDGDPADNQTIDYTAKRDSTKHKKGDVYKKVINPGSGVHVAYEDHMIDDNIDKIMESLSSRAAHIFTSEAIPKITSGQKAGYAVLHLVKKTQHDIHPKELVEAFKAAKGKPNVSKALYDQFGDRTITVIARGSIYLAAIWEAAWKAAGNKITDLTEVDKKDLQDLYKNPANLQSYHLDTIAPHL